MALSGQNRLHFPPQLYSFHHLSLPPFEPLRSLLYDFLLSSSNSLSAFW